MNSDPRNSMITAREFYYLTRNTPVTGVNYDDYFQEIAQLVRRHQAYIDHQERVEYAEKLFNAQKPFLHPERDGPIDNHTKAAMSALANLGDALTDESIGTAEFCDQDGVTYSTNINDEDPSIDPWENEPFPPGINLSY